MTSYSNLLGIATISLTPLRHFSKCTQWNMGAKFLKRPQIHEEHLASIHNEILWKFLFNNCGSTLSIKTSCDRIRHDMESRSIHAEMRLDIFHQYLKCADAFNGKFGKLQRFRNPLFLLYRNLFYPHCLLSI